MEKVLVFDVWGDYAHFRTFYTTSSPLTFPFPPKPTLHGLVSAIIGLDKRSNAYLEHFQEGQCQVGIRILANVTKIRWTLNLINTKNQGGGNLFLLVKKTSHEPRTPIRTEFVKDPKYRIYWTHREDSIYSKLKIHLLNHTTVYTPSFGLSELLLNWEMKGEFVITQKESRDWVTIHSVVPEAFLVDEKAVQLKEGTEVFQVLFPVEMDTQRVVHKYDRIFYEGRGNSHNYRVKKYWEISNGERIILF